MFGLVNILGGDIRISGKSQGSSTRKPRSLSSPKAEKLEFQKIQNIWTDGRTDDRTYTIRWSRIKK